jgi:hypothetical protein
MTGASADDPFGRPETVADIGGGGRAVVLALAARYDIAVDLVDLAPGGGFADPVSGWVADYVAALAAAGQDAGQVRVVSQAADLRAADLVLNLSGFGDRWGVRALAGVMDRLFHAESRMIVDIRKGSGGFPFLKARGRVEMLGERVEGGQPVKRVRFTPAAPVAAAEDPGDWPAIAASLAGHRGFYRDGGAHSMLFVPRGAAMAQGRGGTLVVTFDNLDIAMAKRDDRRPWGYAFIEKQGWSMLGVMAQGWTWYRDPWVFAEFDRLRDQGFFARFDRVVFYGASMGGYAACAFVPACPGADVLAISPQSTLDRGLVPWETRYETAWGRDFGGPYGDAATTVAAAGRVFLLYDPYETLDAGHAARIAGPNVLHLRAPLLGHRLGSSLAQMGLLAPITVAALDGTLTPGDFYRLLRARRDFPRYQRELFQRAVARGRKGLARRVGAWVLAQGDHRAIRLAMKTL